MEAIFSSQYLHIEVLYQFKPTFQTRFPVIIRGIEVFFCKDSTNFINRSLGFRLGCTCEDSCLSSIEEGFANQGEY